MLSSLHARHIPVLGLLVSGGLLLGAYAFQYIGGLEPCLMCYWQRHAHKAVLLISLLALIIIRLKPNRSIIVMSGLAVAAAFLVSFGYGFGHAGVEYGWWEGPKGCAVSANPLQGLDGEGSLLEALNKPIKAPQCSDVTWSMLGLSMAGWNALVSLLGALAALILLFRKPRLSKDAL